MEDSEANGEISDADAEKGVGKRVAIAELITELRHKYITILKMHYSDNYSQGQCQPSSILVLIESADRALDNEKNPLNDWEFIRSYIVSDSYLGILSKLTHIPYFGTFF